MPNSSQIGVSIDQPAPQDDRRIWVRYPSRRLVYCQSDGQEEEAFWPVHACDISLGGIKLLAGQKLGRGTILKLALGPERKEKSSYLAAEVRYAMPSPEGKWVMGCAFLKELSEKDLPSWLQRES